MKANPKKPIFWGAACALALLVMGCGTTSPRVQYYTLAPVSGSSPSGAGPAKWLVAVRPVSVPDVLKRPQILIRTGENTVTVSDFQRWAGSFDQDVTRVLVQNLHALLQDVGAAAALDVVVPEPHWVVAVYLTRFDGRPEESVVLHATWSLKAQKTRSETVLKESVITEQCDAPGYEGLAAAQSRALAALSREIAAEIKKRIASAGL
uniref:ABC-type transport auxiliary lipoprotein component domain-containing protein n=1 Tax=Desulfacinum infernum TaxID=35837 RepID=A0A832A023_9BACT